MMGVKCLNYKPPEIVEGTDPGGVKHGLWPAGFCGDGGATASGATSATSGASASGTDTETSGGSGGEDNIWLCSLNSYDNCADVDPDWGLVGAGVPNGFPGDSSRDACWHDPSVLDGKKPSKCVEADTKEAARLVCEKDCLERKAFFLQACADDIACSSIVGNLDCDLTGVDEPHLLSSQPSWYCVSPLLMLSVWDGVSGSVATRLSGTFTSIDGKTVPLHDIPGYVGFEVSDCNVSTQTCDLEIDVLEAVGISRDGAYLEPTGGTGSYSFDWGYYSMKASLHGTWSQDRQTIVFDNDLILAVTVPSFEVDSETYVPGYQVIATDQVVGSHDSVDGDLEINATFNGPFGTLTISLNTLP